MSSLDQEIDRYRIKSAVQMTGLTTHVIRKWEKRYKLFTPKRSANGYRVYSDRDLQLLTDLKSQLDSGKTIGELAAQGSRALQEAIVSRPLDVSEVSERWREKAKRVIQAAKRMDQLQVESVLSESFRELGHEDICREFFFPILRSAGLLWHQGNLTISSEHLISQTIRRLLAGYAFSQQINNAGPSVVVGCMPNDFHDIGAITATVILQQNGWKTFYLGPDGDIELIHLACIKRQSKLVVLACVTEQKPEDMKKILNKIAKFLIPISKVVVGGLGANVYRDRLEKKEIYIIEQLHDLKDITPMSFGLNQQPFTRHS